jgi:2'-5' RNA ligase
MDRTQLVIVALPTEDDFVRKVSSEKEPHLTLLYLGEDDYSAAELVHIMEYVGHATSQVHRFGLDVVKRGELGDSRADVLFFNKEWSKEIELFRSHLLQDPMISAAYHSTDQFPQWTPHLTMGYPETPAKKDPREYPGFSYVSFDRIAVWTGESEGPEFELKSYGYDNMAVAMSGIKSPQTAMEETAAYIKHYGVKGMKWGVRRSDAQLARSAATPKPQLSEDARTVNRLQGKIQTKGTGSLSNQEMRQFLERMDLEQRYSRMVDEPPGKSRMDVGNEQVKKYLGYAKTYGEVRKFMNSDTGKVIKTGLKAAAAAGFGYATGGAGPAAAAGAGVIVRRATQ